MSYIYADANAPERKQLMLREQLWFDFCDDLPIEIEQRIDEGILEAERFKERAEQVKEMPRGAARTAAGAELLE